MRRDDASASVSAPAPILSLNGLSVRLPRNAEREHAIADVSLALAPNEILCVVGESGSGKSMTSSAIMRLLPPGVSADRGSIVFDGRDLLTLSEAQMREVRGAQIAMIFQEPMTALNPLHTIGAQIGEMFRIHTDLGASVIEQRVLACSTRCACPTRSGGARLPARAVRRPAPARDDRDGAGARAATC
jgi:peptide/nickel transport system ATP-binding protein